MTIFNFHKRYDYNLVVIGAGSAGLVAAYIAAAVKAKVALVEKHRMGGDCLNTGCVPSKALLRSASVASLIRRAHEFGLKAGEPEVDFTMVMERIRSVIEKISPHDSIERYRALGVDCFEGEASITTPHTVKIKCSSLQSKNSSSDEISISTRSIIIATGATPTIPRIPGLESVDFFTSDTIWQIKALPEKLMVLGGGPIGCEIAQAFSNLGSEVTIVQRSERLMKKEDSDVSKHVEKRFRSQGIRVLTGHTPLLFRSSYTKNHCGSLSYGSSSYGALSGDAEKSAASEKKTFICTLSNQNKELEIDFDTLLVASGRRPDLSGLGIEKLGMEISDSGSPVAGEFMQTTVPDIFCAGDVAGHYQFTHTASHQSWYATVNALFGRIKRFRVDYSTIPWATFIEPEVAKVGLNETEAMKLGVKYEVTRFNLDDLDRAIADSETEGFVKVLTVPGKDRILGVTIVGHHASEIIMEFILAMKHGLGLNRILGTIHIYPTMSEANKYAAGQWKRAHAPKRLLSFAAGFHKLMRY